MRDLLTALAGAVILVLVAALAGPPLVDWQAHRGLVDRTLSRSLGLAARTEGRVEVRLLPSPRLRIDRLHLGGDATKPSLDARFVKAEVALAPLLKGEFRFTETRIGRAEIKLPVTASDALRLPPGLLADLRTRELAIEDLSVQQFLLTTQVPATGRTDQFYAEDLRLQAPALTGPWRVEGASGGVSFRAVSGTPGADGRVPVKISGGGDAHPRFEADARLGLAPTEAGEGGPVLVEADGTARLVVGPPTQAAGAFLPFSLGGAFKAKGAQVRFEGVNLEIDPGRTALRLAGTGRLDLRQWRAGLSLEARRLDLDAFLTAPEGQALIARGLPRGGIGLPVMLDLDLAVDGAMLGTEEWSDLAFAGTFERAGGLLLRRLSATGPGGAAVSAGGQVEAAPFRFAGPVSLAAPRSEALGRFLRRLGAEGPLVAVLDGRPVEAAADLSAAAGGLSLRNLRLALGPARITGNARYTAPEAGQRGRFEAQIRASGIDVAALPPAGTALDGLRGHDFAVTLEARDVRFGPSGTGGTIAASVQSDGSSLVVDSLDVANLAGASARLSGRIGADGAGRIAGRLQAPVAAPLAGLLARVWLDEIRLLPAFLRDGALDLSVALDRAARAPDALRIQAKGSAGGGTLDLALATRGTRIEGGRATLATPRAGLWFGRGDIPGLQAPAELRVDAERPGGGALALTLAGKVAGLTLATGRPIVLGAPDGAPTEGEIRAGAADLGPFLTLAGAARLAPGPWPADLAFALGREGGDTRADISGRIAGAAVAGRLARAPEGSLRGALTVERLSLPQLAAALAIPTDAAGARFTPPPPHPPVALDLRVATLELGRSLTAADAALTLGLDDGTVAIRDLTARLAEGRLSGSATIARRGPAAAITGEGTLDDASIAALADGSPITGRLSAVLRFATTAESVPALAAGLAGSGTLTLKDLAVPEADPAALGRALSRALEIDDPLREGRLAALVGEELSKGAAQARGPATAPATVVAGVLRAGPLDLDLGAARWSGTLGYDLREGRLDARGTLAGGGTPPRGWSAGTPAVQLGFGGTLAAPERSLDVGALSNGLAALVLQRELEKIELTEADQVERQRRRARIEMDRQRAAALKAAAERAAAEEAQRQARARAQQTAAEEAARQARSRGEADGAPLEPVPETEAPEARP